MPMKKAKKPSSQTTANAGTFPAIRFRPAPNAGALYLSGRLVLDETFVDGRLATRYLNANGQVWPDLHFGGRRWPVDQPADTFHLAVNGQDLAGGYTWEGGEVTPDPSRWRANGRTVAHGVLSLLHRDASIGVKVHTRLDGSPFVIRWLEIANVGKRAVGITGVAPFGGAVWTHRYEEHLPADRETPFELAYNHLFEWGREGDFWFEPLASGRKTVNGDKKGRSGWGRPAFWARNLCNGETFVCELAWGGNYEFALDCRLRDTNWGWTQLQPGIRAAELCFRMGLSGHDGVLRVLDPGETVETPAVHAALFHDDVDTIVQATHAHVRQVVMPAQVPGRENEIEANHRGYLCDRETVPDIRKDIDVAATLGAELYVIDAGWYGQEPNQWWSNAGDWFDGAWLAKDGGLQAIVDHARTRGLKFGLWVEIEAAGGNSKLKRDHPDWLLKRDGQPITGGRALDLTNPAVLKHCESEIERLHALPYDRIAVGDQERGEFVLRAAEFAHFRPKEGDAH